MEFFNKFLKSIVAVEDKISLGDDADIDRYIDNNIPKKSEDEQREDFIEETMNDLDECLTMLSDLYYTIKRSDISTNTYIENMENIVAKVSILIDKINKTTLLVEFAKQTLIRNLENLKTTLNSLIDSTQKSRQFSVQIGDSRDLQDKMIEFFKEHEDLKGLFIDALKYKDYINTDKSAVSTYDTMSTQLEFDKQRDVQVENLKVEYEQKLKEILNSISVSSEKIKDILKLTYLESLEPADFKRKFNEFFDNLTEDERKEYSDISKRIAEDSELLKLQKEINELEALGSKFRKEYKKEDELLDKKKFPKSIGPEEFQKPQDISIITSIIGNLQELIKAVAFESDDSKFIIEKVKNRLISMLQTTDFDPYNIHTNLQEVEQEFKKILHSVCFNILSNIVPNKEEYTKEILSIIAVLQYTIKIFTNNKNQSLTKLINDTVDIESQKKNLFNIILNYTKSFIKDNNLSVDSNENSFERVMQLVSKTLLESDYRKEDYIYFTKSIADIKDNFMSLDVSDTGEFQYTLSTDVNINSFINNNITFYLLTSCVDSLKSYKAEQYYTDSDGNLKGNIIKIISELERKSDKDATITSKTLKEEFLDPISAFLRHYVNTLITIKSMESKIISFDINSLASTDEERKKLTSDYKSVFREFISAVNKFYEQMKEFNTEYYQMRPDVDKTVKERGVARSESDIENYEVNEIADPVTVKKLLNHCKDFFIGDVAKFNDALDKFVVTLNVIKDIKY